MKIRNVFVAGAGLMGGGIAQVCAQAGYSVVMRDLSNEVLEKSMESIQWSVGKLVEKGKVAGGVDEIISRIEISTELATAERADFLLCFWF